MENLLYNNFHNIQTVLKQREGSTMDCPICQGNGELEAKDSRIGKNHEEEYEKKGNHHEMATICFRCGGTGYLEQID